MEPIEWIIIAALIFGGHELHEKYDREKDGVAVVEKPAFEKGKYYLSQEGYFITDLHPQKIADQHASPSIPDCPSPQVERAPGEESTAINTPLLNAGCEAR